MHAWSSGSVLAALRYSMHFRIYGWHRVSHSGPHGGMSLPLQRRVRANAPAASYWLRPVVEARRVCTVALIFMKVETIQFCWPSNMIARPTANSNKTVAYYYDIVLTRQYDAKAQTDRTDLLTDGQTYTN